jgi:aryl-alcohol dehydrogenase-like predicted oxidoreductase
VSPPDQVKCRFHPKVNRQRIKSKVVFASGQTIYKLSSMKYRRLGKTGLKVSVVGIGTWQYGGEWGMDFTQPDVDAIFDAARHLGINLIDTAECYGDHTSEAFVGNAVQRDRANWIIATKFGHKFRTPFNRTDERASGGFIGGVKDGLHRSAAISQRARQ